MNNIHPYNAVEWEKEFKQHEVYAKLVANCDNVLFNKFVEHAYKAISTPRHKMSQSFASGTVWYYLNFLDRDQVVYDLGCGVNFFKPYFPNLLGISPETASDFFGDIHDYVDDDFLDGHREYFESVFSINALHFRALETLPDILCKFAAMLQKGGRGFIALNAERMLERSKMFVGWDTEKISTWISEQFDCVPCKILVLDVDLSCRDAPIDGNIRAVFAN